jgi:hypothetical protein
VICGSLVARLTLIAAKLKGFRFDLFCGSVDSCAGVGVFSSIKYPCMVLAEPDGAFLFRAYELTVPFDL